MNDLRYAFRQLTKAPGFTAIIVLTLALSIGACTAIYSALDSIVLHPYDDPATERNVILRSVKLPERVDRGLSFPDFLDLKKQATSFELMARHSGGSVNLTGTDEPLRLRRYLITSDYFDILGIKMALGRAFLPEEFVSGNDNVIVVGYACWQRTFGGASDIIGRTLQIDDKPCTVVGVISERWERTGNIYDLWVPRPTELDGSRRNPRGVRDGGKTTIGRLRRGVTIEQAQSELDVIATALAEEYPETNKGYGIMVVPFGSGPSNRIVPMIQVLFGAVGCLMLIACANVASLLLVRANARQREMSVRAALGASRGRLIRQLLTENILVALLGGAAGVLLAQWALDFIRSFIPTAGTNPIGSGGAGLARLAHLELDGGVLAFALILSIATALIFGLAPAWLSSSADLNETLKQGTRGSTEGRARGRVRATLVVVEIAVAVTLLACSGLLIRSFLKLSSYDPGFDPKHTAFVRLNVIKYETPEQQIAFANALLFGVQSVPAVESAGATHSLPLSSTSGDALGFEIEGVPVIGAERPLAILFRVSPDYFRTMGIPLKQGRVFSDRDDAKGRPVAIINQTLARQHFPNQDPIGKRIKIDKGSAEWREIVGVAGDVGQANVNEVQPVQFYEPYAQTGGMNLTVVVRGHGDATLLPAIVKAQVHALDPNLPVGDMSTFEGFLRSRLTAKRLTLHLLTAFAAIGLLIAAIGIYSIIAFSVSQRTQEIGIRMALGAKTQDILRLVLRQGAWLVGIGFVVGIGATFVAGRAIESQLYNTSGHDPVSLVGITIFFAAIAALACWLPARRATKVDPIVALRAE